jgi:nucleoside-diphosphate-sugar epimerase
MRVLVTGGAGFIGSSIVTALAERGDEVRILDDLSTGHPDNLHPDAEVFEGSVADEALVKRAVAGCHLVFHEAAARAVLRSVEAPLETDTVNTHGTLTVLKAAADAGVGRLVYASSSSVYGGAAELPTPETVPALPKSPYAVTKLAGEHYCRVFASLYGLETVALRYFNVFGPRQRPDSMYAAVIPLFIDAVRRGRPVTVHGDGTQSRDFTFISDVVQANLLASTAPAPVCSGKAYNVAPGQSYSLLQMLEILGRLMETKVEIEHTDPRAGDIKLSQADARAAGRDLGWRPEVGFEEGLARTLEWFSR